jgi:hypothetical protein
MRTQAVDCFFNFLRDERVARSLNPALPNNMNLNSKNSMPYAIAYQFKEETDAVIRSIGSHFWNFDGDLCLQARQTFAVLLDWLQHADLTGSNLNPWTHERTDVIVVGEEIDGKLEGLLACTDRQDFPAFLYRWHSLEDRFSCLKRYLLSLSRNYPLSFATACDPHDKPVGSAEETNDLLRLAPTLHVESVSELLHSLRDALRSSDVLVTSIALSDLKSAVKDAIQDQTISCFERASFSGVKDTLELFEIAFSRNQQISKSALENRLLIETAVNAIDEAIAALKTLMAQSLYGKGGVSTLCC